jgi:hypothetical protein
LEITKYDVMAVFDSITFIPGFGQYCEILSPSSFQTFFPGLLPVRDMSNMQGIRKARYM